MSEEQSKITLPFDEAKQLAVLGHLMMDLNFWNNAAETIQPEWFQNSTHSVAWGFVKKVAKIYRRRPTIAELKSANESANLEGRATILALIEIGAPNKAREIGLDIIVDELEAWNKTRIYMNMFHESTRLFNERKWNESYKIVKKNLELIEKVAFTAPPTKNFSNYEGLIKRQQTAIANGLTFGVEEMDRSFVPLADIDIKDRDKSNGGFLPGETTILMSGVNVGKTATCITVAVSNIKKKKHVLFMIHEDTDDNIMIKIWCCYLGVKKYEFFEMIKTDAGKAALDKASLEIDKYLTFHPIIKAGNCVEDVIGVIRKLNDERKKQRYVEDKEWDGRTGYDLLINDYPDVLTSNLAAKGQLTKRERVGVVYGHFVDLDGELGMHGFFPQQVNREANRINRGTHKDQETRLLDKEDASESFEPVMRATNIITLNRTPYHESVNMVLYKICKSRSGETGDVIVCQSDYAKTRTHGFGMKVTKYKDGTTSADKAIQLLLNGKEKSDSSP